MDKDEKQRADLAKELSGMSDAELKETLEKLRAEEERVSYRRRILHGKIDVLRAELVIRLKGKQQRGERLFTKEDIVRLGELLTKESSLGGATTDEELF
jgi:hypothetical protein